MLKIKVPYLLERYRGASSVAAFLLLNSLVLLLFGAISLPIFKPVYIFALEASPILREKTPATELRFGVWGLCAAKVVGNHPELIGCTSPQLGYYIRDDITALIGMTADATTGLRAIITKPLLSLLVLHPVAAGLVFLSLLLTLFLASTLASAFAVLFAILGALAGTIAFAADLAMVTFARQQVAVSQFSVASGSAVWTVLAAVCMTWTAGLVLFFPLLCF